MKRTSQQRANNLSILFACALFATHAAHAVTHTWTNVTAGTFNWSSAANWDAGVPPSDGTVDLVFSNHWPAAQAYVATVDASWGTAGGVQSITFQGGNSGSSITVGQGAGVANLGVGAGGVKLDATQAGAHKAINVNLNLTASQKWFIEMNTYTSDNRFLTINNDLLSPPDVNWILGGRTRTLFNTGSSTGFLGQVTLNGYAMFPTTNQYGRFGSNPIIVDNSNNLVAAGSVAAPRLVFNDLSAGAAAMHNGFVLNLTNSTGVFTLGIAHYQSAISGTGTTIDSTNSWSGRINSGTFLIQAGYPLWDNRYAFKFSGNNSGLFGPTSVSPGAAISINRICAIANNPHAWGTNNTLAILAGPANNRLTGVPTSVLATDGNTVNANIRLPIANQGMPGNRNPRTPVSVGLSGTGTVTFAGTIQVDGSGAASSQCQVHMLRLTAPSNGTARFTGKITEAGGTVYGAPMQILGLGDVALYGTNTGFKSQTLIRSGRLLLGSPVSVCTNVPVNLGDTVSFPAGGEVRLATTMPVDKVTAWSAGTFTFSSAPTIDGVVPSVGDRVLVKNESSIPGYERHGIYTVNSATSWSRAADLDEAAEFVYGLRIQVTNGTANAGRAFFLVNQEDVAYTPLVMNSTASGSYAYFGFNDEPSANPDVAFLTAAGITVSNKVVVSDNLSSGTSTLGGTTADASVFNGDITLNRDVQVTAAEGGAVTFSGVFSGTGGITKTGLGTVYLTGTNTCTGTTVVNAGVLVATNAAVLGTSSNIVLAADGELAVSSGGWSSGGTVTLNVSSNSAGRLTVGGTLALGAESKLVIGDGAQFDPTKRYTFATGTACTGTFGTIVGLPLVWHVAYYSDRMELYYALPGTIMILR